MQDTAAFSLLVFPGCKKFSQDENEHQPNFVMGPFFNQPLSSFIMSLMILVV
jgi:hypothetical protein